MQESDLSPQSTEKSSANSRLHSKSTSHKFGGAFVLTFILLFATWILLSGKFDLFHLALGVLSCAIVSYISSDLVFESFDLKAISFQWPRFIAYIPWLLIQVFKANIHVMVLVLHPKMMQRINPRIIRFKSRLKSDVSITAFANSITLTPGTITVYVTEYGDFEVHVIDKASGDALPGEMEKRIAKIFDE
jgi:multicomponent Na+:H+ antiporter subunit E